MQVFFCKITEKFLKNREIDTGAVKLLAFLYKSALQFLYLTDSGKPQRQAILQIRRQNSDIRISLI